MLLGEFEFHGLTRSNRGNVFPVVDVQCAPLFCILLDPIWVKTKSLKFPTFSGHSSNCALSEFGRDERENTWLSVIMDRHGTR